MSGRRFDGPHWRPWRDGGTRYCLLGLALILSMWIPILLGTVGTAAGMPFAVATVVLAVVFGREGKRWIQTLPPEDQHWPRRKQDRAVD